MNRALLPLILLCGLLTLSARATPALNAVVASGQTAYDADGTTAIGNFATVYNACVNAAGDVVFMGILTRTGGVTTFDDEGIWVVPAGSTGTLNYKMAREGDAPPDGNGVFNHFSATAPINNHGVVAFRATIRGTPTIGTNAGIYKASYTSAPAVVSLVARKGSAAPNVSGAASGALFDALEDPVLGDDTSSTVAFRSTLRVGLGSSAVASNNLGMWTNADGTLKLLARRTVLGDTTIADAPGSFTKFSNFVRPCLNDTGGLAFFGTLRLRKPVVNAYNSAGIWSGANSSALAAAPRTGRTAPEIGDSAYFSSIPSSFGFNGSGNVAFNAGIGGNTFVNFTNNSGIWIGNPSAPDLLVREADGYAGANGEVFDSFSAPVLLSDAGDASFVANLYRQDGLVDATNDTGIWKGLDADSLALVAREADSAPDENGDPLSASEIVFFKFYGTYTAMNRYGQVAFRSMLRRVSSKLSGFADDGIWATETDDTLVKVVRDGDVIGGKTVQRHTFVPGSGGNDARPRAFSFNNTPGRNVGQLVFTAYFTGGDSGVYLADVP